MTSISRRKMLGYTAAAGVGSAVLPAIVRQAMAAAAPSPSLSSVKHVVFLMQENRSFDHYYGTLQGVRGFGDTSALRYPGGSNVFDQNTKGAAGGGTVLPPWHLDTTKTNAQQLQDLDHSWTGTHNMWNGGLYDNWIPTKTGASMGYFTRNDVPYHYALADAFTICDQYFCSVQGPTHPNRLYLWTGTVDPEGKSGGPVTTNTEGPYTWTTYPEMLQNAGVSWRVYQQSDNYDCNPLAWFTKFKSASTSSPLYTNGMARVTSISAAIKSDIAKGAFPTVSWVVAPSTLSEHPSYRPADGANYVNGVLSAIASDQATWDSTVIFYTYDENDGFFDHVAPPVAPAGTTDEYISGAPIGLGPRVPMTVISPWSTGGRVCSQVFDHTSPLQFAELVTGVSCTNISAWRRQVSGNLTSAFTFGSAPAAFPTNLPNTAALVTAANSQENLNDPSTPTSSTLPPQEAGDRPALAIGYVFNTTSTVGTAPSAISYQVTNTGSVGGGFSAYTVNDGTFAAQHYLCPVGGNFSGSVPTQSNGLYDVDVHGPDGYVRGFRGSTLTWSNSALAHPEAHAVDNLDGASLTLTLTNTGAAATVFTIAANAAYLAGAGSATTVTVAAGASGTATLAATSGGRYDYTVTANTGDGFARRFAGRLYKH